MQTKKTSMLDFDEEAKALWERLNLDPSSRKNGQWNPIDSIWRWVFYILILEYFSTAIETFYFYQTSSRWRNNLCRKSNRRGKYCTLAVRNPWSLIFNVYFNSNLLFRNYQITHVVNCTHGESKIPNFHEGKLKYYTFPVKIYIYLYFNKF